MKALADAQIGEAAREQILHRNSAAMMMRVGRAVQRAELLPDTGALGGIVLFDSRH